MKIVVLDGYTLNPGDLSWEGLKAHGELTVYDRTETAQIIERISDCEIIFTNKTPLTEETLKACPNIKFIGVLATGYNIVDIQAAKALKIPVCNIPNYGTDAVAQYVFALVLALCHHVELHSESVYRGDWTKSVDFCYWKSPLIELAGKTMGIIGVGRIGKRVSEIALAFGMNVVAYAPRPNYELVSDRFKYVDLEDLYRQSDVISLHVPLFESTKHMINRDTISIMKEGVIIINTSRGPLINEADLASGLIEGKVKAAAVDVVSSEPIEADNVLLKAPNLIITPHIAWAPLEARKRLLDIAIENLSAFVAGKAINVVNQ